MYSTSPMLSPLQSQHASTLVIGKHNPPTAVLALDLVKAERRAPELAESADVRNVDSDEIKTRMHPGDGTDAESATGRACQVVPQ